jgi:hypothetical protein
MLNEQVEELKTRKAEVAESKSTHGEATLVTEPGDDRDPELPQESDIQRLEMQKLRVRLDEQKMQAKQLQLNLAGKIVVLEEQIDRAAQEKEEAI